MLIGRSPAFLAVLTLLDRVARYDAPVLIEGETGTGKELAARAIHYKGARSGGPFVPINCGAIPENLVENELFGHVRGAYTDASYGTPGLIRLAEGGTLFLDEIDALSPKGQVTLLRFVEDGRYRPLGSKSEYVSNVRIIAASNRNLEQLAARDAFRADLLFRLRIMSVELPPLRARHGDPALLARHFVSELARTYSMAERTLAASTLQWLDRYSWPGNVRELEHVVHREFLMSDAGELRIGDGPRPTVNTLQVALDAQPTYGTAKARAIEQFHRQYLSDLMKRFGGNVSRAARAAGKERRALGKLISKYGIEISQYREA